MKIAISPTAPVPLMIRICVSSDPVTNRGGAAGAGPVIVNSAPSISDYSACLHPPARFDRSSQRPFVEIVEFASDRHALRQS